MLVALFVTSASVAALPAQGTAPSVCPNPTPRCFSFSGGPRAGGTLNGDQWAVGGHLRLNLPCLGGLALEPVGQVGLGGNHMTLRPSLRLLHEWWLGGRRGLGIYPVAGASFIYYVPVGPFASWCNRYDVHACWGFASGFELGGGLEYRWAGLEVIGGFSGLPAVTIMGTATFSIWDGSNDRSLP
jgi:hypothetical protein